MKKFYLAGISLFLIYLCVPSAGNAQTELCNSDVTLSSQAQVDAWPVTHGCSLVLGDLTISGDDITNLDSLYSMEYVNSDLFITGNPVLTNLDGLSNFKGGFTITIENNPMLLNLDGLSSTTGVWGSIKILSNEKLQNIDGLSHLVDFLQEIQIISNPQLQNVDALSTRTTINKLAIGFNASLTSLQGLSNLTKINTSMEIYGNASLPNLDGLNAVTAINGLLRISGNTVLTNVDALSSLTEMSDTQNAALQIGFNPALTNLDGFSHLTKVSGSLRTEVAIVSNAVLADVNGLAALTNIKGGLSSTLSVTNNPNLAMCCGLYTVLYNHHWSTGVCQSQCSTINVSGNGASCTDMDILHNCVPEDKKCNGDIFLATQESIDQFSSDRGCTVMTGTLTISGTRIANLHGLSALTEVGNLILKDDNDLKDLSGLEGLTKVDDLTIINMPLKTLKGFSGLTTVGGSLTLNHNYYLSDVDGLENLGSIGGSLTITRNDKLLNLDGLSGVDSIGSEGGVSITITNNLYLEWCCGIGGVVQDHHYSGSIDISNNSAGCTTASVEAGGVCCPDGSELPADKYVFAEIPKGYGPLSTNIIVRDYEPGILYELHNDADDAIVAGPGTGDIGLYAGNITTTTTFNVLARNGQTGCRSLMTTKPVVTILSQPDSVDCSSRPSMDKMLVAENDTVPPGGATNIIVLNYDDGVQYVLRNDTDTSEVAGPWPGSVGLYTGALNESTTFNVLAIDEETGCEQQMSQKITVEVMEENGIVAKVYPNPADGEFTLEWPDRASDTYYISVTDFSGNVIRKETIRKNDAFEKTQLDLRPLRQGIYYLSIQSSKGSMMNKKLMVK